MKALCIPCNLEFPTSLMYKEHKKSVHSGFAPDHNLVPQKAIDSLPDGITEDMLPNEEFMKQVERIESGNNAEELPPLIESQPQTIVTKPVIPTQTIPQSAKLTPTQPQEIKLEYKYSGSCPEHPTTLVDTLMLDVEGKLYALAYCSVCKTNKMQKKVVKL